MERLKAHEDLNFCDRIKREKNVIFYIFLSFFMGLYYHKIDFFSRLVVDRYVRYNHRTIEIGGIGVEDYLVALSQYRKQEVLRSNEYTCQFGLSLSEQDIEELMIVRRECLQEHQRVEFGKGVLEKLIYAFCDSSYIYQENYVDTLSRLQDIFYLYKNESMDELTDDELIEYMRKSFDETCHGSLDYLEETCLEEFARNIRRSTHKFIGRYVTENEQG